MSYSTTLNKSIIVSKSRMTRTYKIECGILCDITLAQRANVKCVPAESFGLSYSLIVCTDGTFALTLYQGVPATVPLTPEQYDLVIGALSRL